LAQSLAHFGEEPPGRLCYVDSDGHLARRRERLLGPRKVPVGSDPELSIVTKKIVLGCHAAYHFRILLVDVPSQDREVIDISCNRHKDCSPVIRLEIESKGSSRWQIAQRQDSLRISSEKVLWRE